MRFFICITLLIFAGVANSWRKAIEDRGHQREYGVTYIDIKNATPTLIFLAFLVAFFVN